MITYQINQPSQPLRQSSLEAKLHATEFKTYGKTLGAFLSALGYAAKLKDEDGQEFYVNKNSLAKFAFRAMKAEETVKRENVGDNALDPKSDEYGLRLCYRMMDIYDGFKKEGYSKQEGYLAVRGSISDLLKGKDVQNLDEVLKKSTDPKLLEEWKQTKLAQYEAFEKNMEKAGMPLH